MFIKRLIGGRIAAVCLALACGPLFTPSALAQIPAPAAEPPPATQGFDIPAQDLHAALIEFGRQSGQELLYAIEETAGKTSNAVTGDMSRTEAMTQLLSGTGLEFELTPSGGMVIGSHAALEARRAARETSQLEATAPADDGTPGSVTSTRSGGIEEIIVTAQKKEENIQNVPIAISAFSAEDLRAQKIEGGTDLLKAIPNVTFSKNNFTGYNFSIRGIGTKAVSSTTDPGVAVSYNYTTLLRNRLFEQEYFDIDHVEVLRGPQGTLYGRNANGGVVNVITHRPDFNNFSGSLKTEVGNYDSRRADAFVNIPLIDDMLAMRVAGAFTNRSGYGENLLTGKAIDGRDLYSTRVSLAFKPIEGLRADFVWEHFNEDDDRARTSKQLCHHDPGPESIGGVDLTGSDANTRLTRAVLSQGCTPGPLHGDDAYGRPEGAALPYMLALQIGNAGYDPISGMNVGVLTSFAIDPYAGLPQQSHDLRAIESQLEPRYQAQADIYQLNLQADVSSELTLYSQTLWNEDSVFSTQDYNRFASNPIFTDTSGLCDISNHDVCGADYSHSTRTPGGYFTDPQLGTSNRLLVGDLSEGASRQFSQEIRLQSAFDGPLNFSVGANYLDFHVNDHYYVFANTLTAFAQGGRTYGVSYIDNNPIGQLDGMGHNYFHSQNPYKLKSASAFGELYWQMTDRLKMTTGLRYTDDRKTFTPYPSLVVQQNGYFYGQYPQDQNPYGPECSPPNGPNGEQPDLPDECLYYAEPDIKQRWQEVTGRFGFDWRPELPFTDQSMLYAFYSRGYKGGGANPPPIGGNIGYLIKTFAGGNPTTYKPEFVNAFEIGSKNVLAGGRVVLNGDVFFYDYKDYQVSQIVDRIALNENFDAKVWGVELESIVEPIDDLRFNANLGYLQTRIGNGEKSIDSLNRTAGNPDWVTLRPWIQFPSNCIAPAEDVATVIGNAESRGLPTYAGVLIPSTAGFCGAGFAANSLQGLLLGHAYDRNDLPAEANNGRGFDTDLSGNELPNSPHLTFNVGLQYTWHVLNGWEVTPRADYYRQSSSWARVYNTTADRLRPWGNANVSLLIAKPMDGLQIEAYVKNVFNDTPITDAFLNSDDTGLTTNVFTLDPRLVGIYIKKDF